MGRIATMAMATPSMTSAQLARAQARTGALVLFAKHKTIATQRVRATPRLAAAPIRLHKMGRIATMAMATPSMTSAQLARARARILAAKSIATQLPVRITLRDPAKRAAVALAARVNVVPLGILARAAIAT